MIFLLQLCCVSLKRFNIISDIQLVIKYRDITKYTIAKDVYNIGKDDYRSVFFHLVQLNRKDLERVAKDDGQPIWVVNLARAILKDTGRGEYKTIDAMFEKFITERDVVCGNSATLVASIPERVLLELADRLQDEDYDKMASE